jgi:hypothetical protein
VAALADNGYFAPTRGDIAAKIKAMKNPFATIGHPDRPLRDDNAPRFSGSNPGVFCALVEHFGHGRISRR